MPSLYIIHRVFTTPGDLFLGSGKDITAPLYAMLAIVLLLFIEFKKEYFDDLLSSIYERYELLRMALYAIVVFLIAYIGVFNQGQFIYFQF